MTHIDIHVIQSVPPSNLNRDDTGSPKTALYGGVRRARVSSQAWKRAARQEFAQHLDASELGVRTKRAVELLVERIHRRDPEVPLEEAATLAQGVLEKAGLKVKAARKAKEGDAPLTEYLVFFSNHQLDRLADLAIAGRLEPLDARAAKDVLKQGNSIDVALFGRMVADDASINVDAACQVAHALSTHGVSTEFDYYTAVDDQNPEEETGAGMIGTIEFDSATLYRYATINVAALRENLGDDEATVRAVEAFVRAFALSMPTGKQNTFANRTSPDGVVVLDRAQRPVNLVGAFEEAVRGDGGFVKASCEALATHGTEVDGAFGNGPRTAWVSRVGDRTAALDRFATAQAFDELVASVGAAVRGQLSGQP